MKRLTEVAQIHSGYPFRRAIEPEPDGKFAVIQMRDLNGYTKVNYENLALVNGIEPKPHHLIQQNDILLIAKGVHNFAAHIDKTVHQTVAAANFLVIRNNSHEILPAYLAWFVNQEPAQTFLRDRAKGSYIPSISKGALSELSVPVPPLAVQKKIVRTHQLLELEGELISKIQSKRAKMIESLLLKSANGGETHAQR